jgi:hypothetical protein
LHGRSFAAAMFFPVSSCAFIHLFMATHRYAPA